MDLWERYSNTILARGGSVPASDMAEELLGRSLNEEAYLDWLSEGVESVVPIDTDHPVRS